MIKVIRWVILFGLATQTKPQSAGQTMPVSPCPNIFTYEQRGTEQGKWYGVIHLTTDTTLYSLWLNVVLDSRAEILGNWVGEVKTKDNIDFKIENTGMKIVPGPPIPVRFFVQYNTLNKVPALKFIRLNGKEICNIPNQNPEIALVRPDTFNTSNRTGNDRKSSIWPGNTRQGTTAKPDKNTIRIDTKSESKIDSAKNNNNINTTSVVYATNNNVIFDTTVKNTIAKSGTKANGWLDTSRLETIQSDISRIGATSVTRDKFDINTLSSTRTDSNSFDKARLDTISKTSQNSRTDFLYDRKGSGQEKSSANISSLNQYTTRSNNFMLTTSSSTTNSYDSSLLETDSEGDLEDDTVYDDIVGGIPTIFIPGHLERSSTSQKVQCGTVVFNNTMSELDENGVVSLEGLYPWHIALYQNQRSGENKYICGGTLVTHRHVITAAHCVTKRGSRKRVNQNTLTLYLGKTNLRTSVDGVQVKFVEKVTVHPEYNATTLNRDLAILQLKDGVTYTDHVRPACLWPESLVDQSSVIGKHGSLVGWGFESSGVTRQELSLVKMPVVDLNTCIKSYNAFFARIISESSYCAKYAEGTSICNGDSGGGMVFKSEDSWYLRGVASLSITRENQYRCDPNHFFIFTDVAKLLPWIKNNIYDY